LSTNLQKKGQGARRKAKGGGCKAKGEWWKVKGLRTGQFAASETLIIFAFSIPHTFVHKKGLVIYQTSFKLK